MSQYDAAANPLFGAFAAKPDPTAYTVRPARVDIRETNREDAPGAEASLRMNLVEADLAPELELNEILWKSVRGADAVMPPPIRAAFVRPVEDARRRRGRRALSRARDGYFLIGVRRMLRNSMGAPSDCSAILPATSSAPVPSLTTSPLTFSSTQLSSTVIS